MSKPLNIAYESFSMFFSPAYMQMRSTAIKDLSIIRHLRASTRITMATLLLRSMHRMHKVCPYVNRRRVW